MTRAIVLICPLFLMVPVVRAQDPSRPAAVLARVEESIRTALADLSPKPTYEHHARGSLSVTYKARKFIVHGVNMTGQYSEKAHEEYGPSVRGFILNIQVQSLGIVNQAGVPQTLKRPYWRTDIDVTKVRGTDVQLFWALSYGNRPDPATMKEIKRVIYSFGPSKRKGSKGAPSSSGAASDRRPNPTTLFPQGATR